MTHDLNQAIKNVESLITKPAESLTDPDERMAEFQRRLGRTRRLMAYLDDPQQQTSFIHVGGTSGKGSIAIICESVLKAIGQCVGTHTSPYLQTPLERARVNARLIDPPTVVGLSEAVMAACAVMQARQPDYGKPHYAEAWLGIALRYFAEEGCDTGVVEVGMGGRYDATNILTPRVSVISTVHYDHVLVLGDTLADIAYHKAGIIKAGVPVVVGEASLANGRGVPAEALQVIEQEASRHGSSLIRVGRDVTYRPLQLDKDGGVFDYDGLNLTLHRARIGLTGAHQFANAAAALAALEIYASGQGMTLDPDAVRQGLAETRFAGRLEAVQTDPLVVLDGAHNEEKIGALIRAVPDIYKYDRLILVLGMLEAKQAAPMVNRLSDLADVMVTTSPRVKGKPAINAESLASLARDTGVGEVKAVDDPRGALEYALSIANADDLVLVTGSLYLIGMIRGYWYPLENIIDQRNMFPGKD